MDYKKLIIYLIVILVGAGIWFRNDRIKKQRAAEAERFAEIYAGTTVMAELYRNDAAKYFAARDSILAAHDVDSAWVFAFENRFKGNEEKWTGIWSRIEVITDSLIEYFKEHPLVHDSSGADSLSEPTQSQ